MVFSSLTFICIFLPAVLLLTLAVPGQKGKNLLLAVFSLIFYAYGEPIYVLLMFFSTVANWAFGRWLGTCGGASSRTGAADAGQDRDDLRGRQECPAVKRRLILAAAVILNLSMLFFFKYAGMLISTVNTIFGIGLMQPQISLPVGISFYTFQAMSYVIDVYRGEADAQKSYLKILLYISFFPQLIAGPIVRYRDIERQLEDRRITLTGVSEGFRRFCFGLAKKVLISNTMGIAVDAVFEASRSDVGMLAAWIAAVAYMLQIYFDFSGYSDMAIGLAKMFGFTYRENFNYPYAACSVQEFWRRWHISLSSWLKEYLYIPLGGNRKGRPRAVLNKLIVFFCCGLWHGAAWTFVVWGLVHGLFLLLEEYVPIHRLPKPLGWLYTMLEVTFAFVIFRAEDLGQAVFMTGRMIFGAGSGSAAYALALEQITPLFLLTLVCALFAAMPVKQALQKRISGSESSYVWDMAGYVLALGLLVTSMLSLASGGYNPFIYFRF